MQHALTIAIKFLKSPISRLAPSNLLISICYQKGKVFFPENWIVVFSKIYFFGNSVIRIKLVKYKQYIVLWID